MKNSVMARVGDHEITLETGRLARQTDGAVLVTSGNNVVLVTVVSDKSSSGKDFFPLTVEFSERYYSTGRIPGGFFKREGKPSDGATLTARLIDRPMRPCFPEGYMCETQIIAMVLSADGAIPLETLASVGASAAVHISDIPFNGPTASTVVGRVGGVFIANPNRTQLEQSDMSIVIAGTRNGILMVEGETQFLSEADVLEALKFGHQSLQPLLAAQEELREKTGNRVKREFTPHKVEESFNQKLRSFFTPRIKEALRVNEKQERYAAYSRIREEAQTEFLKAVEGDQAEQAEKDLGTVFDAVLYEVSRHSILDTSRRIGGRALDEVRKIQCEVALLPRAHGSGLFTRGETQVLGTVTLGTSDDEKIIDALEGSSKKRFLLHYNFPPFSVGETGRFGGQSRREIGHGFLAERALKAILPAHEAFPYTIRVVSEVLESNGSSSMGTVCSGLLALLDAGVPVTDNVAGIAMGLIKEGERIAVLSDILGDEDHLGDMDFKVAGSRKGITALQMDIKIDSISFEVMKKALAQAREGREHILNEMEKVMKTPRGQISEFAPRIVSIKVKPDKVRLVIGAGGKVVRSIIEETGVKIDIEDDGTIHVASSDPEASKKAVAMIEAICADPEVGQVYTGKVVKITDFGAFIEVLPNTQGLLHISEIAHERVRSVGDHLKEGDQLEVKILDIDRAGRIKLSRKVLLTE